ncbi:MAG: hypothetical protein K9K79_08945 [Desulfohalobiaceae bacterium]|nr:hypothetical protein [Desulfohalobiaceae bacterium]
MEKEWFLNQGSFGVLQSTPVTGYDAADSNSWQVAGYGKKRAELSVVLCSYFSAKRMSGLIVTDNQVLANRKYLKVLILSAAPGCGPVIRKGSNIPEDFQLKFVIGWGRIGPVKVENESWEPET